MINFITLGGSYTYGSLPYSNENYDQYLRRTCKADRARPLDSESWETVMRGAVVKLSSSGRQYRLSGRSCKPYFCVVEDELVVKQELEDQYCRHLTFEGEVKNMGLARQQREGQTSLGSGGFSTHIGLEQDFRGIATGSYTQSQSRQQSLHNPYAQMQDQSLNRLWECTDLSVPKKTPPDWKREMQSEIDSWLSSVKI